MSYRYDFHPAINLYVEGRISKSDAKRQEISARTVLQRLENRPGMILADEVGMGKTFVALSVAASVALKEKDRRPVVVMVPPSLREKWPKDFEFFRESCILSGYERRRLDYGVANNAIEFLKFLDDAPINRKSIIFLTHGAMSPARRLTDGYVKLAIIQKALYRKRDAKRIKEILAQHAGELLRMMHVTRRSPIIWRKLLNERPEIWLSILKKYELTPPDNDDPVPQAILETIEKLDFDDLFLTLQQKIPLRHTKTFDTRLKEARDAVNEKMIKVWDECIRSLRIKLPLLILDEAHHLKNAQTHLASLFQCQEAEEDKRELSRGPLAQVFERMLFLTATPFQLGHYELCSVLERFGGISWESTRAPSMGKHAFLKELKNIHKRLDAAQEAAVRLDHLWGQLRNENLIIEGQPVADIERWWKTILKIPIESSELSLIIDRYNTTKKRMQEAEQVLKPFLIRHVRPKMLPGEKLVPRRQNYVGKSIIDGICEDCAPGIEVEGNALLTFLLAARLTALRPDKRPVFAEGLASSYEAFLHTREKSAPTDEKNQAIYVSDSDDNARIELAKDVQVKWYLEQLQSSIPDGGSDIGHHHPKIQATANRVLELWQAGEKVLVFCHYVATGKALQKAINEILDKTIIKMAARKLSCSQSAAAEQLESIGKRFFKEDSPIRRTTNQAVLSILDSYPELKEHEDIILRTARRYLRTPSFLARYFPLKDESMRAEVISRAFKREDASGMSLEKLFHDFFGFFVKHCGQDERLRYLDALENIQTGSKVRLANGSTDQTTRQRLMLTFNTPFYPEVLVASSIMAEGVDLHLNCRHVIHHDLCWNPSTLEQREPDESTALAPRWKSVNSLFRCICHTLPKPRMKKCIGWLWTGNGGSRW